MFSSCIVIIHYVHLLTSYMSSQISNPSLPITFLLSALYNLAFLLFSISFASKYSCYSFAFLRILYLFPKVVVLWRWMPFILKSEGWYIFSYFYGLFFSQYLSISRTSFFHFFLSRYTTKWILLSPWIVHASLCFLSGSVNFLRSFL